MKIKNDLSVTYKGYLQQAWYTDEITDPQDISRLLNNFKAFAPPVHHSLPLFFVIDYTARQYLVMTDAVRQISGYAPQEFMESNLDKLLDVFNKDDFKVYNQKIFTRNTAFLKETPQEEHQDYIFSYTFRFMRSDKKTAHVLQRGSYITSKETGMPLYSLGMLLDITNIKTDAVMVHTIEKNGLQKEVPYSELISRDYYYPNMEDSLLTKREKTVLQYFSDGCSSKQVAHKMCLSEHTVVTHKQNMLRKTNTKNIVELVTFAIKNRII